MQDFAPRLSWCVAVMFFLAACEKAAPPVKEDPPLPRSEPGETSPPTPVPEVPPFSEESAEGPKAGSADDAMQRPLISPEFQAKVHAALAKDASMETIIEVFMSSEFEELMMSIEKNYDADPEVMAELEQSGDALAAVLNPQAPVSGDAAMRNVTIKQEEVVQEIIRLVVAQDSEGFYEMLIEVIDETTVRKALGEEDNVRIVE